MLLVLWLNGIFSRALPQCVAISIASFFALLCIYLLSKFRNTQHFFLFLFFITENMYLIIIDFNNNFKICNFNISMKKKTATSPSCKNVVQFAFHFVSMRTCVCVCSTDPTTLTARFPTQFFFSLIIQIQQLWHQKLSAI